MAPLTRSRLVDAAIVIAVLGLPLLGATLTHRDVAEVFRFPPPLRILTGYLHFSWLAVAAVMALLLSIAVSWASAARRGATQTQPASHEARGQIARHVPWWGWIALGWTAGWWVLAWTRYDWFETVQRYTFFPLWLGFIVTTNALTHGRAGTCLMRRNPRAWCGLFLASALFWWAFEWLNRFVRNWHYLAVEGASTVEYVVHASLCFSTVLPAVAAVAEWLTVHPRWIRRTREGPAWTWLECRSTAVMLAVAGVIALGLAGAYPTVFYAAVWVAPLALGLSAPVLLRQPGLAREIAAGDWTRAATWMIAALICGFFWELWNWRSLAQWIYTVPGVERWYVFEMPLLGFAGYLPFGLECLLAAQRVAGRASLAPPSELISSRETEPSQPPSV